MFKINTLTSDPYQKQAFYTESGTTFSTIMRFAPMQYGWFLEDITYLDLTIKNLRICNSPNMLHQWKNLIPFGLSCRTIGGREPSFQRDFSTSTSILYILTMDEVEDYARYLSGQDIT